MDLAELVSKELKIVPVDTNLFPSAFDGVVETVLHKYGMVSVPKEFCQVQAALLYGQARGHTLVAMWSLITGFLDNDRESLPYNIDFFLRLLFTGVDLSAYRRSLFEYLKSRV